MHNTENKNFDFFKVKDGRLVDTGSTFIPANPKHGRNIIRHTTGTYLLCDILTKSIPPPFRKNEAKASRLEDTRYQYMDLCVFQLIKAGGESTESTHPLKIESTETTFL
jgi:hypothetical protein